MRYRNNSNYKQDTEIRKKAYVSQAVLDELKRIIADAEVSCSAVVQATASEQTQGFCASTCSSVSQACAMMMLYHSSCAGGGHPRHNHAQGVGCVCQAVACMRCDWCCMSRS